MRSDQLQNEHYFRKKCIVDTDVGNDVTCTGQSVITRGQLFFFKGHYPLNNCDVI